MATSTIPAVIAYLVATFTQASTLGQASPPVRVYDGPTTTGEAAQLVLWVGIEDPDSDDPQQAAITEQTWAGLGAQRRDELLTVNCVAEAWDGADALPNTRDAAYGIVAAVENLLRADVYLGQNVLFAGVSPEGLIQKTTEKGVLARVPFRIEGKARI